MVDFRPKMTEEQEYNIEILRRLFLCWPLQFLLKTVKIKFNVQNKPKVLPKLFFMALALSL